MNRWKKNQLVWLCGVALLVSFAPQRVMAQAKDYLALEPAPTLFILPTDPSDVQRTKKDKVRVFQTQVQDVLQGKVSLAEKQTVVESWYVSYIIPKLTLYTPEALAELPKERDLFNKVLSAEFTTDATAHEFVVNLALKELAKIVNEDYHPAVRYNAMLMITDLNKVEMNRKGDTPTPAEIYVPALQFMLKELENKDQIEYVRIAALIGLVRHVSSEVYNNRAKSQSTTYKIPNAEWDRIRKITLGILRNEKPAADKDPQGHQWLRRRAMEILSWMAAARPEPEIVKELIARAGNSKESRGVRCEAVLALGNTLVTGPVTIKPTEVANSIAMFIVDAVEEDGARLAALKEQSDEFKKIHSGEGGSALGPGGDGMRGGPQLGGPGRRGVTLIDPYDYRLDPTIRRLKHEIGCATYGLIGSREKKKSSIEPNFGLIALYKKPDEREPRNPRDKDYIDSVAKLLQEVAAATNADDTKRYIKQTHDAAEKLREKVLSASGAAPAAVLSAPADAPAAAAPSAPPAAKTRPEPTPELTPE